LRTPDAQQQPATNDASFSAANARRSVLRELFIGPVHLFALASGLALLVALGLLVAISWRGLQRLEPFDQYLQQQRNLLALSHSIRQLQTAEPNPTRLLALRTEIRALVDSGGFADPTSSTNLLAAARALDTRRGAPVGLAEANTRVERALTNEGLARRRSISAFHQSARAELGLAIAALLVLPATAVLVLMMLRERIVRPLRDLNRLLALLGERRLTPAPTAGVVLPLQPLMENYNQLVQMLSSALNTNKSYQEQLESQVRAAAETIVRQRITLAEADRLSAIGEISARVAHELRNPLAGIQVGLANLLQDCSDPDQRERLRLIAAEVERMAKLLDEFLMPARRRAETRQRVQVQTLISDLLDLARYQIPDGIRLINEVPNALEWCLERDTTRQMLLNLILNASQAIGKARGSITVIAACEDRCLRISVHDDGPGFPTELLVRGPRSFYSSRIGGSGLGLSTVSRMARSMGGQLELRNSTPKGAIATLVLPGVVDADGHASDH
jgi:two-component system, NtrC family, sensor kinase